MKIDKIGKLLDKLNRYEERDNKTKDTKRKNSKCYNCVWGKWLGNKYYCMFPNCVKNEVEL